ncbi:MAG: mechanosensitive ion channel [Arenicellales bacterium]|nr:mechanosensitive ion channel [Arenicellales bacterium]
MKTLNCIFCCSFLFFLGTIANQGSNAVAQTEAKESVAVPEALGPEAMSALVSKLDEEQTEALIKLMELLNASAGAEATEPAAAQRAPMSDIVMGWVTGFGDAILAHISNLPTMIAGVGAGIGSIFADRGFGGSLLFLTLLILAIAIGLGAEWVFNRITAKRREEIKGASPDSLLDTLKVLSRRAVIQIGGLIVFAVVALFAIRSLFSAETDRLIATSLVLQAILIARITAALLRFVLAPTRTDLRLVSTDDQTAQYIYRQLVSIAAIIGVALFVASVMSHYGIAVMGTFRFWVGLFVTAWVIYITWQARHGLTSIIKGEEEHLTPGLEKMAAWWPAFSIVVIALDWLSIQFALSTGNQTITPGRGALSLALIVVAPFLDTMVRGIAAHLVPAMQGEGPVAEKAYHETRLCYVRMGRIVLFAVLIIAIAKLRGISLYNLTETGLGSQIAANSMGFLLILAFGYMAWEITNLWINRRLAQEMPQTGEGEESGEAGGAGLSRMATILPILRMTLQATIITITVLLALSQLGVNITPLLAGAGVLGLAIGFGAQTLVKDVVSGVFFLLDDAFRVGEYIDVGGTQGSVEKISVRSLQLRGATGPVHIVPYGSMSSLTNMSRDWVTMKLKFTVPFDTDLEKVRKIFKKIGQQIQEIPEYADDLISPFKSQGAADVTDVGIVVRGKFTTKPGGQWGIRKEIYNRVQKAFEENGIEFARKEVWVQMPSHEEEGTNLTPDQKKAISAAASQAAEPT